MTERDEVSDSQFRSPQQQDWDNYEAEYGSVDFQNGVFAVAKVVVNTVEQQIGDLTGELESGKNIYVREAVDALIPLRDLAVQIRKNGLRVDK